MIEGTVQQVGDQGFRMFRLQRCDYQLAKIPGKQRRRVGSSNAKPKIHHTDFLQIVKIPAIRREKQQLRSEKEVELSCEYAFRTERAFGDGPHQAMSAGYPVNNQTGVGQPRGAHDDSFGTLHTRIMDGLPWKSSRNSGKNCGISRVNSTNMKYLRTILCFSLLPGMLWAEQKELWTPLFNGKDLTGWTPKIRGCVAGENFKDTFRVEDGLLKVDYRNYKNWDNRFGHLFYREKFSHYRLRLEYRFVGDQITGGPGWAYRNSGVMIHSESPETMELDQDFPTSLEVQLLGGAEKGERTTGNLCTPGTHVHFNGALETRHCISSSSGTHPPEEWVTLEIEVKGGTVIRHLINGKEVLKYEKPVLGGDAHAEELAKLSGTKELTAGYICLQSESHPVEFRKVEILATKKLDGKTGGSHRSETHAYAGGEQPTVP